MSINKVVTPQDVKLGDVIQLAEYGYMTATVTNITNDEITLFRPYVTTSEFSFTNGVIPYIGIEQFKVSLQDKRILGKLTWRVNIQ